MARRVVDAPFCDDTVGLRPFGKDCVWHLRADYIDASAFVISAGVGKDVSMEHDLVRETGCRVALFDPSPTGRATMQKARNHHPRIDFRPLGIAGRTGDASFGPPAIAAEGSMRPAVDADNSQQLRCMSLSDVIADAGVDQVELVKIDIEGFEYEVIDDIVQNRLPIQQLCLEVHHFMPEFSYRDTLRALSRLGGCGFRLVHKVGCDYTLLHESRL